METHIGKNEIKVKVLQHPLPIVILKIIAALIILPLSLIFYLTGLLLSLTIIGAVIGIPFIISTYAMDALAISVLLNPKEKIVKVFCPNCGKGKYILPKLMEDFTCKGCGRLINIIV